MSLKTNYKDDVFSGNRKYREISNADGSISFEDITEYSQEGDSFGSSALNEICAAVNSNTSKLVTTKKTITIQPEEWIDGIYTLNDQLITMDPESNQEFLPPDWVKGENDAVIEAIDEAQIKSISQTNGQAKIGCKGEVPSIAIQLIVVFRGAK